MSILKSKKLLRVDIGRLVLANLLTKISQFLDMRRLPIPLQDEFQATPTV